MPVSLVNAGRAPALRVTGNVTLLLSGGGSAYGVAGEKQHSWSALLTGESMGARVQLHDVALGAMPNEWAALWADILVEHGSASGRERVPIRDVASMTAPGSGLRLGPAARACDPGPR